MTGTEQDFAGGDTCFTILYTYMHVTGFRELKCCYVVHVKVSILLLKLIRVLSITSSELRYL
jgi:hypothetical protein